MKLAAMWRSTQKESRIPDSEVARSFVVLTGYTSITASHKGCLSVDRQSTFMYVFRCLTEAEKSAAYVLYSKPSAKLTLGTLPYMQVQPIVHAPLISRALSDPRPCWYLHSIGV
jgi:hypothetical protein